VLEEAPQFTAGLKRSASPRFSQADFVRNNGLGMALTVRLCSAASLFPNRGIVVAFFIFGAWQSAFNAVFHAATTAAYGVYSPGLITSLILYPALLFYPSRLAYHENLLAGASGLVAMLVGGTVHTYVVAVQVYRVSPFAMWRSRCNL
jgi:hypothetical protein